MDLNNILNNSTDEFFARKGSFKACYPQIQASSTSATQPSLHHDEKPRTLHSSSYSHFQPSYSSSPTSIMPSKEVLDRKTNILQNTPSTTRKKSQHSTSNFRIAKNLPVSNLSSTDLHSSTEKHMQRQAISNSSHERNDSITSTESGELDTNDIIAGTNPAIQSERARSTQINEGHSTRKRASSSEPWYDDDESTDGVEEDKFQKVKKSCNKSKRSKAPNSAWSQEEDMKLVRYRCSC